MWHRFFAVPAFIRRFRSCIAARKLFLKTSTNISSRFHGSLCGWQRPEASSIMRALSGARCTGVRLYTLWIKIGTSQRALGEHSHYWTRLRYLGEIHKIQKCAHRLSPVDDNCHIKYINIHRYASRVLDLFLNCSNATHPLLDYWMFL